MKKHSGFSVSTVILVLYGTLVGGTGDLFGVENNPRGIAVSGYSYNPVGKPDPFRSFLDEELAAKKTADLLAMKKAAAKRPADSLFPLRRSAVDQYKLRGIAGNALSRTAIVEDGSGKFYPISPGTIIGQENGKVAAILPDRVIVEQTARDRKGQSKVMRITMKLHEE
jgi:type IV pilus assembly protein PilP